MDGFSVVSLASKDRELFLISLKNSLISIRLDVRASKDKSLSFTTDSNLDLEPDFD